MQMSRFEDEKTALQKQMQMHKITLPPRMTESDLMKRINFFRIAHPFL